MTEYARLVVAVDSTSAKKASDDLRGLEAQAGKTERSAGGLVSALRPLAGIFATLKVGQLVTETTMLSSRYNELGIVMEVVGKNAGYSREQLDGLEEGLKRTGISAIESRNNIARMISANIDLAKATELARLAQDAAVIGGLNSSDAFQRLVRGIQTAEIETLRNIGLNVSFERSYEDLASQLGKTAGELSELEKVQARTNAVLGAAPNIAGAYEASLDNAGKALRSSTRYLEDFQVKLGQATQPAFTAGVEAYSNSLKFLSQNVDGVVQVLETGLYVVLARGTSAIATNTGAMIAQAVQQGRNNVLAAEAAGFELRKAAAARTSALADLDKARASEAAAIATVAQVRANQQLFAMQVALAKGTAEYAALSKGLTVVNRELALSEQAVAAATAARTAAVAGAATATAGLAKASAASTAANVTAAASNSVLSGALRGVAGIGGRVLGLLGGPVGLAFTVGAVALSFIDFSDKADTAEKASDDLAGSVDRLSTAAERAQNRFAGLTANMNTFNKAETESRAAQLNQYLKREEQDLKRFQRLYEAGNKGVTRGLIEQKEANIDAIKSQLDTLGASALALDNASTKEGSAYIKRLNEQRALLGAVTEEEKVRAQIREGLVKVSPGEEQRLILLAREVDAYQASEVAAKESARASEQSTEKRLQESQQLISNFESVASGIQRELDLYGQVTEAAKVRYELENGGLKGIIGEQATYLLDLARELDAKRDLTEQEKLRIDILRESGQLRAANDAQFELEYAEQIAEYERQGNQEALQRLETLRQIRAIQIESAIEPGTVEGVSRAPDSQGADAMFGGAAGEFAKLEEERIRLDDWRATELEMQRAFLEAKAINEQEYAERVRNIQEQHATELMDIDYARQQVALTAAEAMFGDMADLTKQFAGENSAIYKTMFAVEKGIAIARALVAIQTGIALAAANPFPANLAAMATVAASTAGLVSNIASIASFEGGGSTGNGPRVGGLDGKGGYMAMVHPQETIIDHTKSGGPYGGKGGGTTINLIEDASRAGQMQERQAPGMDGKQITDVFVANIRQGGAAAKAISDAFGVKRVGR